MARQQTAQFPLDGGIDQRTHERYVQPPNVLDAVNVRYRQIGGVEKRPGCEEVASAFSVTGGTTVSIDTTQGMVARFRDELLVSDGVSVGSLSAVAGTDRLIYRGRVPEAVGTLQSIATTGYYMSSPDVAYAGGLIFSVWSGDPFVDDESPGIGGVTDADTVYYSVQDSTTGAYVVAPFFLSSGASIFGGPRVVAAGSSALAFYYDDAGLIYCHVWDSSAREFGAAISLITDNTTGASRDFDVASDGTNVFLVHRQNTDDIRVHRISTAGAILASTTGTEANATACEFGIAATAGEVVWVSYAITSGGDRSVRAAVYTLTLGAESVAPFTVATYTTATTELSGTSVARRSATTATIVFGLRSAVNGRATAAPVVSTSGAIVGNATAANRTTYWCYPGSKPFQPDASSTKVYVWVYAGAARLSAPSAVEQQLQWTFILGDLSADDTAIPGVQMRPVTWVAPRFASARCTYKFSSVASLGSGRWAVSTRISRSAAGRTGLAIATADFEHPAKLMHAELGQTLFMVPGWFWDGTQLSEIGYAYWPQKPGTPTFSNNGGAALVAGTTYRWRVLYESTDALGFVHRSQPSDYVEATVSVGDNTATLDIPSLCITARQAPGLVTLVRPVLYRTKDVLVDPNTYYRVHADYEIPLNETAVEIVSIDDFGTQQLDTLYTQGGVLPNVMPHGCTAMATYRNRLWIAYGNTVAYSKSFVTGEAVSFTDSFTLPLEESGDITALWSQDDALYISTEDRIYFLAADGPNDLGALNDVTTPNRVATDLGVLEPRSVVVTPMGTLYQSRVGIQLMDRGRNVAPEPVGSRVQQWVADYGTVTSALVHPTGSYVTFALNDGSASIRLVFDYSANKWSRDIVLEAEDAPIIRGAANLGGTQYFLAGGAVYRETSGSHLDAGAWVTQRLSLAWFKPAGLQGYADIARFTLHTERSTSSNIAISSYSSYELTAFGSETWLANSGLKPIDSMTIPQMATTPARQRVQAMRWVIEDATPTGASVGTGAGHAFVGLAIDLDVIAEAFRMPAAQKG